jgi:hypothetical protein
MGVITVCLPREEEEEEEEEWRISGTLSGRIRVLVE